MENDYLWEMFWKIFWLVVVVVGTARVALRRMKDKQKLTDLAMYATVEAEKQKWLKKGKTTEPSTGSGQAADCWRLIVGNFEILDSSLPELAVRH